MRTGRKVRFPLEMKDGVEVRDLEGLKDNFSLERILLYLEDGKLDTWLRDRYLDDIADAVSELDRTDTGFCRKICEIFEVEDARGSGGDRIAYEQDDLYDLLDEGENIIYLSGERFSIPLAKKGITYIGVNNPTVVISSKKKVDFAEKGISFQNVHFDERYQQVLESSEQKIEEQPAESRTSVPKYGGYYPNSDLNFMLSPEKRAEAKGCYEKICTLLEDVGKKDFDEDSNGIIKFKRMIEKIWRDLDGALLTMDNTIASKDDSVFLAAVYDYEKLNDYGKVIMEQVSDLENNREYLPFYKNAEYRIDQLDWIIQFISSDYDYRELKFIFWALMVLAVDHMDKEEHLSLICDFAKAKNVKDSEMKDIVQVVRLVFHEENEGFLVSSKVRICFEKLLKDFGYQEKPISSAEEGLSRMGSIIGSFFG